MYPVDSVKVISLVVRYDDDQLLSVV
jgi:hypothetical protein